MSKPTKDWEQLNLIAQNVESMLPDGFGFIVLAYPTGEPLPGQENIIRYCSNSQREDVIKILKEMLFKWGEEENWMRHIK